MILALRLPCFFPSVHGNALTIQRFQSSLRDHSLTGEVFSLDRRDREAILAEIRRLHLTLYQSLTIGKGV